MIKIIEGVLRSALIRREIPFRVILPETYNNSRRRYPVLYLLHGLFGCCDNWLQLTRLTEYALNKELIIVLPEGGDNWYTDSAAVEEDKFESYFIEELIPTIDALYRTIRKREKRAVVGLSMGGYGALKFVCKRPDLFVFCGSMSGAFDAPRQTDNNPNIGWEDLRPSILKVFGDEHSRTRAENDLFQIIGQIPAENIARLPYFYIDCGLEDDFLEVNRELAKLLNERKVSFEYHEVPGGHDWEYWDKEIKLLLPIIERKLGLKEKQK